MPELPEVETVKRGLAPVMEGSIIQHVHLARPDLRFPFPDHFADRLKGRKIIALGRRAKYLIADLDGEERLIIHLGMSGSFRIESNQNEIAFNLSKNDNNKRRHDHVCFELDNDVRVLYHDPRRFGFMTLISERFFEDHDLIRNLGVEPTGNMFDAKLLARRFLHRKSPLKSALLNQKIIAGLGNIYVCEALHRAALSPKRLTASLVRQDGQPSARCKQLSDAIRQVIMEAIDAGGSSLRDHRQTDGSLGYFQHQFKVYGREALPCLKANCNGTITRIVQSGRSTFYCPQCQK